MSPLPRGGTTVHVAVTGPIATDHTGEYRASAAEPVRRIERNPVGAP